MSRDAHFAPALLMYKNEVQIVDVSAVRAKDWLGQVDLGKLEHKVSKPLLDAFVRHAMMTELVHHIVFDGFAPGVSHTDEREVATKRPRMRLANEVLQAPFDGFDDLWRRDRRSCAQEKMQHRGPGRLALQDSDAVGLNSDLQFFKPFLRRQEIAVGKQRQRPS
jgi:hypothetical protein